MSEQQTNQPAHAARLADAVQRLNLPAGNPFLEEFKGYEDRLDTGRKAVSQFATTDTRAKQEAAADLVATIATRAAVSDAAGIVDAIRTNPMASRLSFQLQARAAEAAKWYEALQHIGGVLRCDPELVAYLMAGIPHEVARTMYATKVPPKHAARIFGMIHGEDTVKANSAAVVAMGATADALDTRPKPVRSLKPMAAAPSKSAGKRRRL